jgi:ubiquinone/menaquinone biosynthesis C-methylase UbiE
VLAVNHGYIHGYSDDEAERLISQAEFLAPWVFDGVDLSSARCLLEVGVGVGAETRLLRARWPGLRVVGVDVSADQIARARRVLAADVAAGMVELVAGDAAHLTTPEGRCDAAFLCWVLEHVGDPRAVLAECARVLAPGSPVWLTEVYNASLVIEPRQPVIDEYWRALNDWQRAAGGHPNIGARLPELAESIGLRASRFRFVPVLGDARDPVGRRALLRYFRELLRSAEGQLVATGAFHPARAGELDAAFEAVERAPDALFSIATARLEARTKPVTDGTPGQR